MVKPGGTTEQLNDNGDLWWSVLGGGGGVYGVVTQFKYIIHQPPTNGFVVFSSAYAIVESGTCAGVADLVRMRFTCSKDHLYYKQKYIFQK